MGPKIPTNIRYDSSCIVALNKQETAHLLVAPRMTHHPSLAFTYDWGEESPQWKQTSDVMPVPIRASFECTRVLVQGGTRDLVVVAGGKIRGTASKAVRNVNLYDINTGTW